MDILLRTNTKFRLLTLLVFALGLFGAMPLFAASDSERSITDSATGMELLLVKGGCYQMGDTFGDGNSDEIPVHEVCVDDFYVGKYEVTQRQWKNLIGKNPSSISKGDNHPVENITWNDAQDYAHKLSIKSGKHYRLPTEAEWEYAARSGGMNEKYAGSNNIDDVATYDEASFNSKPHPVGQKQPNGIGLYNMSGNVREWCQDWYSENYYSQSPRNNPQGPASGSERIMRGGCHRSSPKYMRSTYRFKQKPDTATSRIGFRLVLQVD